MYRRILAIILAVVLLLVTGGCGSPHGEVFPALSEPLVWPAPPDKARIGYVGSLSTEEDLRPGKSGLDGLTELIFGKKDIGILVSPSAVVGNEDKIYVADGAGSLVHIFGLADRSYEQFSRIGKDATLLMPVGLAVASDRIYVVDSVLGEVCVFDKRGKYLGSFGGELLKRPSGIAYYEAADKLFVADTGGHVVKVFDKSGDLLKTIGRRGVKEGEFNFPTHLCVDGAGKLYVSDTLNYRVQIFSPDGKFLRMFGEHGDGPGYFAHPSGIAADSQGHIYVADRQFENIQIFDGEGQLLMGWGSEGGGPGEFWLPAGIFVDNNNRIYVADSFNKRVQVFELLGQETDEN
jgi:DNA-binding beta-propeller fold protein YncE